MNLASVSEIIDLEKRIAITPEIAKKYISLGINLKLSKNYGTHLGFSDEQYKNLGVSFSDNENEIIKNSDIIIQLGLPDDEKLSFSMYLLSRLTGLEPATSAVTGRCSNQLNYSPFLRD